MATWWRVPVLLAAVVLFLSSDAPAAAADRNRPSGAGQVELPDLPPGQKLSPAEVERLKRIWQLRALEQRSGRRGPQQGAMPPIIGGGPPVLAPPATLGSGSPKTKKRKTPAEKRADARLQAEEKKRQKKAEREAAKNGQGPAKPKKQGQFKPADKNPADAPPPDDAS